MPGVYFVALDKIFSEQHHFQFVMDKNSPNFGIEYTNQRLKFLLDKNEFQKLCSILGRKQTSNFRLLSSTVILCGLTYATDRNTMENSIIIDLNNAKLSLCFRS